MSIASDISDLKDLSDGVVANKVSRFAYTEQAYTDNEADGVTEYDVNADQNIPVGTASIMKVNQTVIEKGWRARASSITRMLMNHFLGRISYNLNKVNDWFNSFLTSMASYLGTPNGIATLDQDGRIPYSQLPESAIELKGYWDASTNTPALVDGTGTNGDEYIVSVAGTRDLGSGSQYFGVGDRVLYTSGVWKNISSGFVRKVSDVQPDAQGSVDLTQQPDIFKILSTSIVRSLGNIGIHYKKYADVQKQSGSYYYVDDLRIVNGIMFYNEYNTTNRGALTYRMWVSLDNGQTWQNATVPSISGSSATVVRVNGYDETLQKYFGVAICYYASQSSREEEYAIASSSDGLTWAITGSNMSSDGVGEYLGKISSNHWFSSGRLYYTNDFVTRTKLDSPTPSSANYYSYVASFDSDGEYIYCFLTVTFVNTSVSPNTFTKKVECYKSTNPISSWGSAFYISPATSSNTSADNIIIGSFMVFRGEVFAYQMFVGGTNKKLFSSLDISNTTANDLPDTLPSSKMNHFSKSADGKLLFFTNKLVSTRQSFNGSSFVTVISFGDIQSNLPTQYKSHGAYKEITKYNGIYVFGELFSLDDGMTWQRVTWETSGGASQYGLGAKSMSNTTCEYNGKLYILHATALYCFSMEDLV